MPFPSITLITPSLNGGAFLRAALESARRQGDDLLEQLIIDGGSIDETAVIARDYPGATLITEPGDSHQAMNSGVARAHGEIIGFLNTDDVLADGALARVRAAFAADPTLDAVQGGAAFFALAGGAWRCRQVLRAAAPADQMTVLLFLATGFNAWFFRRELLTRLGGFDPGFSVSADRAFLIRVAAKARVGALAAPIYGYRMHGTSRTMSGDAASIAAWVREHLRLAERLRAEATSEPQRLAARRFEAFERARLALYRARSGEPVGAFGEFVWRAARPAWAGEFISALRERRRLYRLYLDRAPAIDPALFPTLAQTLP